MVHLKRKNLKWWGEKRLFKPYSGEKSPKTISLSDLTFSFVAVAYNYGFLTILGDSSFKITAQRLHQDEVWQDLLANNF